MSKNIGLLVVKHPIERSDEIKSFVVKYLEENGFNLVQQRHISDVLKISQTIYAGREFMERDIESRKRFYGGQTGTAYLFAYSGDGEVIKELFRHKKTLRQRFPGPIVKEELPDGTEKEVELDMFHSPDSKEAFQKEFKILFTDKFLQNLYNS